MTIMGQQLCSSPTEGYFIGDWQAGQTSRGKSHWSWRTIQRSIPLPEGSKSLRLDRLRDQAGKSGGMVYAPAEAQRGDRECSP